MDHKIIIPPQLLKIIVPRARNHNLLESKSTYKDVTMKNLLEKCTWLCFVIGVTGCASIDFYEEQSDGKQKDAGFLYYPPKPYILIETKGDNTVTSIISLPDMSRPHRVKQDNGWGSAELGFEVKNGMIKSFNSKTDSKGPEALTSIAGLGTAQAALVTAKAAQLTAELSVGDKRKMMALKEDLQIDIPNHYIVEVFVDGSNTLKSEVYPFLSRKAQSYPMKPNLLNK